MDSTWILNVLLFGLLTAKYTTVSTCSDYTKLTNTEGDLTNPRYPKYNPKATRCRWLISAETGFVITLQFKEFDIGQKTECSKYESRKTYLEVRDGRNTSLGMYCGSVKPGDVRSDGNQMWVEYVTNGYKSTMFVARFHVTKESSFGAIFAFVLAFICGTIITIFVMVILIKRKSCTLEDDTNSHVSRSRDSNNDIHRTSSSTHMPSTISLGEVNKGLDEYVISQSQVKHSSQCSCDHGSESYSHRKIMTESYGNRNHDNSNNCNKNNDNLTIVDVDSEHSFRTDRLSLQAVETNYRKTSESESILTTTRVIFVQDSSSSRSGSSSSNE